MTRGSKQTVLLLAASAGALVWAAAAVAQETPAQARARAATQGLNGGPSATTLQRPRAPSTTAAPVPQARQTRPAPSDRTLEDLLASTGEPAGPETRAAAGVTLAPGETEPEPIPMTLGYYARGEVDCDQVWPGDGDLAWATPTAFTLDFGGCEPGEFRQTGPNSWREEQPCRTESGGDAGVYFVSYEVISVDSVRRAARLGEDGELEVDLWTFCRPEDVPENARFRP